VAGMLAFYIVTKGKHPFGKEPDRLRNLIDGKAAHMDEVKDPAAKDSILWMLSHDPKDRPLAEKALKHPYLQSEKRQFEMLCKVGNQLEIKIQDLKSDVVRELNKLMSPKIWSDQMDRKVLQYLCTDFVNGTKHVYGSSWTECLRFIRNVNEHWHNRPCPTRGPVEESLVGNPQKYFITVFPSLPAEVHRTVRSCNWKERSDLKEYFM
jgi:serine/threonine-protein kinase/endoribonuclease IRE1